MKTTINFIQKGLVPIFLIAILVGCIQGTESTSYQISTTEKVHSTPNDPSADVSVEFTSTPAPTQTQPATPTFNPTNTPSPTNTLAPTDTPAPTETPTPDLAATDAAIATLAAQSLNDSLNQELENLGYTPDSGHVGWIQTYSDEITLDSYNEAIYIPFAEDLSASDFILKTEITWESTSGLAGCSLIFRSEPDIQNGEQYIFETLRLTGLPGWDIIYIKYNQVQKNVTGFLTAGAINQEQGSTNKYVLIAEGEKFTLYVNGERIGSYYDFSKSRLEGQFAFLGWQESGESVCTYENTWVWLLE